MSIFDHVREAREAIREVIDAVDDLDIPQDEIRRIINKLDDASAELEQVQQLIY